jgi:hypothetical protein
MRVAALLLISSVRILAWSLVAFDKGGSAKESQEGLPGRPSNAAPAQTPPEERKERRDTERDKSPPLFVGYASTDYMELIAWQGMVGRTIRGMLSAYLVRCWEWIFSRWRLSPLFHEGDQFSRLINLIILAL